MLAAKALVRLGKRAVLFQPPLVAYAIAGDKNISILHLSCRTSDLQFSLILQTQCTCPLKAYAIKNIKEYYAI